MSKFRQKATAGGGGDFEVPPEDVHQAVCVAFIDLGKHEESFSGQKPAMKPKVFVVWELDAENSRGDRFVMGQYLTLSTDEKATLRKVAEAVRGKRFGDDEMIDWLAELLGRNAQVQVEHVKKQGRDRNEEKTYARIAGVTGISRKAPQLTPQHHPFAWEIGDEAPIPTDDWLPRVFGRTVKEVILGSEEMAGGLHDGEAPDDEQEVGAPPGRPAGNGSGQRKTADIPY